MRILITVCGREGSKGLKGKNHKRFLGLPLIQYTLYSAKLFRNEVSGAATVEIAINSDCDVLMGFADGKEIIGIQRDMNLCDDDVPKTAVIIDTVLKMEDRTGEAYDVVIDLDITSPLRKVADILTAYRKLTENPNLFTVFSVTESRRNPYFNMVEKTDAGVSLVCHSEYNSRQKAPRVFDMNASIYAFRREALLKFKRSFFEGPCDIIEMNDTYALDIDSEADFRAMEILAKHLYYDEYLEILQISNAQEEAI